MRKGISSSLLVALLAALAAPGASLAGTPGEALAAARRAIDRGNAEYIETWKRSDARAFAALFCDDAISTDFNGIEQGRALIEKERTESFRRARLLGGTIATSAVALSSDLAYEIGRYSFDLQAPGKAKVTRTGRYLTIWRRLGDGSWKIQMDSGVPDPSPR